jgi:hypothetical protein
MMFSGSVQKGLNISGLPLPLSFIQGYHVPSVKAILCSRTGMVLLTHADIFLTLRSSLKLTVRLVDDVNSNISYL